MKNKRFTGLILLIFCSCGNEKTDVAPKAEPQQDTLVENPVEPKGFSGKRKRVAKEVMPEELKPIRDNFNRINAIEKWTSTIKKDFGETSEGGEADYCYLDGKLEKIVYRQFGENFQKLTEFYLSEDQVSFVFEKESKYNRPIYWDSTAMKESGDNEVWDAEKSEITEKRNFFQQGKLIHQLVNEERHAPLQSELLVGEQKRLLREYGKLLPAPIPETKP